MRAVMLAMLLVASVAHADPERRARALIGIQLAALTDPAALAATLEPDAIILGNGSFALARGPHAAGVLATLGASRSGLPVLDSTIDRVDATGDDRVTWATADITMYQRAPRGHQGSLATRAHIVELWAGNRAVAFGFTSTSGATAPGDVLARPASGVLLAFAIDPVRGRDVRVNGALEVRDADWGVVAAELVVDDRPAHVLVIAMRAERDAWTVVARLGPE